MQVVETVTNDDDNYDVDGNNTNDGDLTNHDFH